MKFWLLRFLIMRSLLLVIDLSFLLCISPEISLTSALLVPFPELVLLLRLMKSLLLKVSVNIFSESWLLT